MSSNNNTQDFYIEAIRSRSMNPSMTLPQFLKKLEDNEYEYKAFGISKAVARSTIERAYKNDKLESLTLGTANVGLKSGFIGGTLPEMARVSTNSITVPGGGEYVYRNLEGIPPVSWESKIFTGVTEHTLVTPPTAITAYIYIDLRTMTLFDSAVSPAAKLPYHAYLGNVDFDAGDIDTNTYIETAYSAPDTLTNLTLARGDYNLEGCDYYGAGALTLGHTAGRGLRVGVNTVNDLGIPDIIDTVTDSVKFVVRSFKNATGDFIIDIHPTNIDPTNFVQNGVLTAMNATKWSVQYIYHFYGSDVVVIYYGTQDFNSLDLAEASIVNPPTGIHQITKEASLRAALIVKGDCTDLTDPAQAKFFDF